MRKIIRKTYSLCALLVATSIAFASYAANQIESVRIWPSPDKTRVVFDLAEKPQYSYFFLQKPHRLVIDLRDTDKKFDLTKTFIKGKLIKRIRYSRPEYANSQRIVLDLNKGLQAGIFSLKPIGNYGDRLVVDLTDNSQKAEQTAKKQALSFGERDIVIAVDAGHGGEDPGSIGPTGLYEKKVTYQISNRITKLINAESGLAAHMVRTGDYYVDVNKRSVIARQHKADLLISIHADAFTSPQPKGASVWMLSLRRANTEIGRWIEQTEQHGELLGGAGEIIVDTQNEKYLAKALLDMSMDHSITTSYALSQEMVNQLSKVTYMHKKSPQTASLGVLKSPDIPSLLIETGFISNPTEERKLNQREHQQKIAAAIVKAIKNHFRRYPPEGTLYASKYRGKDHIVAKGESLSVIAKRYATSVSALKRANKLKSDMLRIGQTLKIPQS
ncbi:N-acetylmuramoyl-L-alanine amidase [Catenovulum agarivorans DS-2]|uniref:N-acetylmuramoyl-L-alanine amidase n=1 Tax=Catenovulum agarivorans DS-2 TaxID=1328313 RepID=W7QTG3_9ALTE|nr:N-acetylmuramoyl-L-alanine amidase [Catenovulum agarivorans]EWH08715.1 N-acetylmuramoyl-L-alanine amidase [Catenovulum agarivorans DS-2]